MQEPPVQFLGWEDPMGKKMATHSSLLAWRIPWTEGPGGLQSMGHKESGMTEPIALEAGKFKIKGPAGSASGEASFLAS